MNPPSMAQKFDSPFSSVRLARAIGALALCGVAVNGAAQAPSPTELVLGVYECTLPGIGIFHGAFFGLVDGKTYRNFDGKRGAYTYDVASKRLTLTSGSSKGMRYVRTSEKTFRVLDEHGRMTGGNCVHNSAKSIDGRW